MASWPWIQRLGLDFNPADENLIWPWIQRLGLDFNPADEKFIWPWIQRLGLDFNPADEKLILDFLYPKFQNWVGPCNLFETSEQVYTNPPSEYCSPAYFPGGEKYYFYTKLEKQNPNQNQSRWARSVGSYGTWHESNCNGICGANGIIGFKKLLNFKEKKVGARRMITDCDWLMHEFSLPENLTNLVLCVIQNKKRKEEEMGSACVTLPELERMSRSYYFGTYCTCPAHAYGDHFQSQALDLWPPFQRLGCNFDPSDEKLILEYLYPKFRKWGGPCNLFETSEQVYTNPPSEYCSPTYFPDGEKYYFYTKLEKQNPNQNQSRWARSVGSYGTWHESNCKGICVANGIIGFKKLLNFKEKKVGARRMITDCDWLMHEFSLPENQIDLVLCVIQKKKRKKEEEMGSALVTLPELDRMSRSSYSAPY